MEEVVSNIVYQNITSIRGRIPEFHTTVNSLINYGVIVLTETLLYEEISNDEPRMVGYRIFCCDRALFTSFKLSGGGVLVEVNKRFRCANITLSDNTVERVVLNLQVLDLLNTLLDLQVLLLLSLIYLHVPHLVISTILLIVSQIRILVQVMLTQVDFKIS